MKRPVERLSKLVEDHVPRDEEENLEKRGRKGSGAGWTSAFTYALLFGYGILLFSAYGLRVQTGAAGEKDLASKLEAAEEANQALLRQVAVTSSAHRDLQETLENSQSELEKLKTELAEHKTALNSQRQRADNLARQQAKCDPAPSGAEADGHLSVKVLEGQVARLQSGLQSQARQLLEARYGKGKYRVVMTLGFPKSAGEPQQETLVMHMASADLMPHTVAYFLDHVSKGHFDGTSFIRLAPHVLQADPIQPGTKKSLHGRFSEGDSFPSVAFQEYSPKYPHKQWRVGLAGRPGGPDFYINLVDNTKNHGPGGQTSYEVVSEADACFAELDVPSMAVVKRIQELSVDVGDFGWLTEQVEIVKCVIETK